MNLSRSYHKKNAQEEQDPSERTEVTLDYEKQLREVKGKLPEELQPQTQSLHLRHILSILFITTI